MPILLHYIRIYAKNIWINCIYVENCLPMYNTICKCIYVNSYHKTCDKYQLLSSWYCMIIASYVLCFTFPQWILHTMLNEAITHKLLNCFTHNFKHINYINIRILFLCVSFIKIWQFSFQNKCIPLQYNMLHVKSTIVYNIKKYINMHVTKSTTGILLKDQRKKYNFIAYQNKHWTTSYIHIRIAMHTFKSGGSLVLPS